MESLSQEPREPVDGDSSVIYRWELLRTMNLRRVWSLTQKINRVISTTEYYIVKDGDGPVELWYRYNGPEIITDEQFYFYLQNPNAFIMEQTL
jgi:hypothetical protein